MIIRKSPAEIDQMAEAGQVVADVIALLAESMHPGVTTAELDAIAEEHIRSRGGVPTFKGYRGYPASICVSPNSMVVHGIPGEYPSRRRRGLGRRRRDAGGLRRRLCVDVRGRGDHPEAERLLHAGRAALDAGIEQARAGNRVGDISAAVQRSAEGAGYAVIRSLVGHGVGRSMHEEPQIPNYGEPGRGPMLETGMTLAIEPMISVGRTRSTCTKTTGRSRPRTTRSRPISSTRWRSLTSSAHPHRAG